MSALRIVTLTQDPYRFCVELPRPWYVVIDYRATCPACQRAPCGAARSKKQARKAMVQLRSRGCGCS